MFGRDRRGNKADAERAALFAALAERPDNICPFLGLDGARVDYHPGVTREHRCYAFGDPMELSSDQQERVCLQRGYVNCPRYLRGVLVTPTEELEAMRRAGATPRPVPEPARHAPPPPPPAPRRTRRGPVLAGLLLLLVAAGGTGAFLLMPRDGTGVASPTPSASASEPESVEPATATPFPETPVPDPTPRPGDRFVGYEVTVLRGDYVLFEVDDAGVIVNQASGTFRRFSSAPVAEITAPNGLHHWRTLGGEYVGFSYIAGESGPFLIREVYQGDDGVFTYLILPDDRL